MEPDEQRRMERRRHGCCRRVERWVVWEMDVDGPEERAAGKAWMAPLASRPDSNDRGSTRWAEETSRAEGTRLRDESVGRRIFSED